MTKNKFYDIKQHFINLYSIYKKRVNLDKYKNLFKNNKV